MSWNNVVPDYLYQDILEKIRREPKQLHFAEDLFPPLFMINKDYLTSCNEAFTWTPSTGGGSSGTISHQVDHPAFAKLRNFLENKGFIDTSRVSVNGDKVLRPFYLNKVYFDIGDRFFSASAMSGYLRNK
jgi:hypothetical protein